MSWAIVASVGGSLVGGMIASKGAGDAADAQTAANNQSIVLQEKMYTESRNDTAPWREAGANAITALMGGTSYSGVKPNRDDFYSDGGSGSPVSSGSSPYGNTNSLVRNRITGEIVPYSPAIGRGAEDGGIYTKAPQQNINTSGRTFDQAGYDQAMAKYEASGTTTEGLIPAGPGEFEKSPGYQFRLDEGEKALERGASARGNLLGGAETKALTEYGQNYATNDYDNFLRRYYDSLNPYMSVAGMGQVSASQGASNALQQGTNVGQSYQNIGNANAAESINQANAWTGNINSGINNYLAWKNMNPSSSTPAPGSGNFSSTYT